MAEAPHDPSEDPLAGEQVNRFQVPVSASMLGRHRIHRSAVRPFICCGSELSLASLVDGLDIQDGDAMSRQTDNSTATGCGCRENRSATSRTGAAVVVEDDDTSEFVRRASFSSHRKKSEKLPRKSKKKFWSLRLRGKLPHSGSNLIMCSRSATDSPQHQPGCICTAYKRKGEEEEPEEGATAAASSLPDPMPRMGRLRPSSSGFNFPSLMRSSSRVPITEVLAGMSMEELVRMELQGGSQEELGLNGAEREGGSGERWRGRVLGATGGPSHAFRGSGEITPAAPISYSSFAALGGLEDDVLAHQNVFMDSFVFPQVIHTQVDYVHCLVPDLQDITKCSFYWGVMDRYEAEKLLENKPEGTFLLRDSAQEEFLFSVSFRRYSRSLHARIEQWNHKFSFDAHDPAVFAAETVCGLIEHYKDPNSCMFFEPMLTNPMIRTYPFSLQHLCRSTIAGLCTYDTVSALPLPGCLKEYLRYYHYKQKVRVRRFDIPSS